jgi:DNA-binding beta-propeller fold protein YncE
MVIGAPPAVAAELPSHILQETIEGPPPGGIVKSPGPLQGACGVAIDPTGRVFASSYYGHWVYAFSPRGPKGERNLQATIELKEPPFAPSGKSVGGPCDLALDAAGNLYVNNWHQNVIRLPRLGASPPSFGPGVVIDANEPTSVIFDPQSGHLFIDDRTYVAEYDSSGVSVLDGGEPVRIGLGSLGDGYGVAVSGFLGAPGFPATAGLVYVADAADNTVKVYDPDGDPSVPVQVIDGDGTPQLGFNHLADADVAVDPVDGHVYVVDNLTPGFELPEAVVDEFSSLGHYRGPVPSEVANGAPSAIVHGEPSAVAIFEHDVYLTDGNYFADNDVPTHRASTVRVYGPTANVETRILTATKTGAGAGTVFSASPAGLGCGSACTGEFKLDTTVLLTALPALHNRFLGWTGCKPRQGVPTQCELAMGADHDVSAGFEPIPPQPLTVTRSGGGGGGTVSSLPAGIDCGVACAGQFDEASEVTLTATPGPGSVLAGWSGCDSQPAPGKCRVTMNGARLVDAAFAPAPVPPPPPPPPPGRRILSVFAATTGAASGTVTSAPAGIACGATCAQAFTQGTAVTLVARPAPGSAFLGWGGCDSAAGERCTVALGSDRSVVAAFGPGSPGPLRLRGLAVHGDSATLRVLVPAAGTLTASGPGLRPASALPLAAGPTGLALRLTAAGRRSLAESRRHELRVRVALAFTPFDGGAGVRATRAVTFRGGTAGADRRPAARPS